METISLNEKFSLFTDHWSPKAIAELNGQLVKLAKVSGEFVWHDHAAEDELFLVVKGTLFIDVAGAETITLHAGELCVIPRGKQHRPRTNEGQEAWIMLFEPRSTAHTGGVDHELTVSSCERI
jgi:quercetin dioxygenase-like cupin family protein